MKLHVRPLTVLGVILAVATPLGLADPTSSAIAAASPEVSGPISAVDLTTQRRAQTIRKEFGLRSDVSYVAAVNRTAKFGQAPLGIPLTNSEVSDLHRRNQITQFLPAATVALTSRHDYAGLWIDQEHGGTFVVQGTKQPLDSVARDFLPTDYRVRFVQVANTLESLDQVENSLTKRIVGNPSLASYIDSSSVDIKQNRIVLALSLDLSSGRFRAGV